MILSALYVLNFELQGRTHGGDVLEADGHGGRRA